MKKLVIGASIIVIGAIVLVAANPFENDPEYHYDDAALRVAVEGTWKVTVQSTPPRVVTFTITQGKDKAAQHSSRRSFVRAANACSHRTFVRSAEACMDITDMPVDVRIAGATTTTEGRLFMEGFEFDHPAQLDLDLGHGESVSTRVSAIGQTVETTYYRDGKNAPATMIRTSAH
jgi:hypothetical protein